jgi:hypothetical protein
MASSLVSSHVHVYMLYDHMIFAVLEICCEPIRQDVTPEHLDVKLQLTELVLPPKGVQHLHCYNSVCIMMMLVLAHTFCSL